MQAPDQHRAEVTGTSRVSLVRGILVIATAVVIGGFMVAQGLDRGAADDVAAGGTLTVGDEDVQGEGAATTPAAEQADADPAVGTETTTASSEASVDEGSSTSEAAGTEAEGQQDADAATETTGPAGPAEEQTVEVKILVLNGAGAKGIAGKGSEILSEAGYDVLAPKNADVLGPSQVLYTEGTEAEARTVAEVFGVDPDAVVGPLDPANQPIGDIRDATIIVVVGQDGLIEV